MEAGKYSYTQIADFFIAFANAHGEPITNLKLQKLVYYAQAWYLANFKKPLFDDAHFEAWVHGPVIPELYHEYKNGFKPIEKEITLEEIKKVFEEKDFNFLNYVAMEYVPETAYSLELMTHKEDPWISARGDLAPDESSDNKIDEEQMMVFYGERLGK